MSTWGGVVPLPEENADLPYITPLSAHLFVQVVFGVFPYHNYGAHLDGGFTDDAIWKHRWHQLDAQLASWFATPSGVVGRRFTSILDAEWQGVLRRTWNSKRPLVFAHVILTKTMGVRRARDIQVRITRCMDRW